MPSRNNRTVTTGALRLEIDEFLVDRQARNLTSKTVLWYEAGVLRLPAYMTDIAPVHIHRRAESLSPRKR